jgi:hypothetical protein
MIPVGAGAGVARSNGVAATLGDALGTGAVEGREHAAVATRRQASERIVFKKGMGCELCKASATERLV